MRNIKLFFILIVCLITNNVYSDDNKWVIFVDVSGSVDGCGYGSTRIHTKMCQMLNSFISNNEEKNIEIFPFCENVFSKTDSVYKLKIRRGNTNIGKVFDMIQKMENEKVDNIFILSDGKHNIGMSIEDLCSKVQTIKQNNKERNVCLIALNDAVRNTAIASFFDGNNHFYLLDSLYVPATAAEESVEVAKEQVSIPIVEETYEVEDTNGIWDGCWLWWILLIIILLIILIYVFPVIPVWVTQISGMSLVNKWLFIKDMAKNYKLVCSIRGNPKKTIERWNFEQDLKKRTGWPDEIVRYIKSREEADVYIKARLVARRIGDRLALVRQDIDFSAYNCRQEWLKNTLSNYEAWKDYNNADLIGEGYPPRDSNGDPYELHHIGQHPDSPLAELKWNEHIGDGNNAVLHPNRESEIDRQQFAKEKSKYWQDRFKAFTEEEKERIYGTNNNQ